MNINTDRIEELIMLFAELNDEYQTKAFERILSLKIEQNVEKDIGEVTKSNEVEFKRKVRESKHNLVVLCKTIEKMDEHQMAQMEIVLEKLLVGAVTKKDEISITIKSKNISLKEYIEKKFHSVNYVKTKRDTDILLKEAMEDKI